MTCRKKSIYLTYVTWISTLLYKHHASSYNATSNSLIHCLSIMWFIADLNSSYGNITLIFFSTNILLLNIFFMIVVKGPLIISLNQISTTQQNRISYQIYWKCHHHTTVFLISKTGSIIRFIGNVTIKHHRYIFGEIVT